MRAIAVWQVAPLEPSRYEFRQALAKAAPKFDGLHQASSLTGLLSEFDAFTEDR